LGGGTGYDIHTEGDFDRALRCAWADTRGMSLLHVHLDQTDFSDALKRLASRLISRV
jgi:indolepyruvate decarboxylase